MRESLGSLLGKPWVRYIAVGLVGLIVGLAAGSGSSDTQQPAVKTRTVTRTRTVTKTVRVPPSKAARAREHRRLLAEKRKVSRARNRLSAVSSDVAAEQAKLDRLTASVKTARANTFSGTGTYLVGSDISPGVYRAAPSSGCYWARLSSLNTSDIIDNNNADGPVVVEISASDRAFEADGCAEFHRIG